MELTTNLILQKTKAADLSAVKNLNLWGSELTDVSMLSELKNVECLSLSVNHIATLKPFAECKMLKELYLRKNDISNISEIYHLSKVPNLHTLWLSDNPCANHELYRLFTLRCCPKLKTFDNTEVSPQERALAEQLTSAQLNNIIQASPVAATPVVSPTATPISSNRQTQKTILLAMFTLLSELTPESLQHLQDEVSQRLGNARRQ